MKSANNNYSQIMNKWKTIISYLDVVLFSESGTSATLSTTTHTRSIINSYNILNSNIIILNSTIKGH